MTTGWTIRYDRVMTAEFLSYFLAGGFADSLRDYASARYPSDLHFRKNVKSGAQTATLYIGMTAVLNVHEGPGGRAWLSAHESYAIPDNHWDPEWDVGARPEDWSKRWPAVENYLERIIPVVMGSRMTVTEGLVQAAVSAYRGAPTRAVLDREVGPSFVNSAEKKQVRDLYSDPLVEALQVATPAPGKVPPRFGMKCDALAVDNGGRLVAIEIKPGNVGSLAWVPAQATMYARVLQHWIEHDREAWKDIINQSFSQRAALGLTPPEFQLPALTGEVVPAVAFQRIASAVYVRRMLDVQEALLEAGVGDDRLRFYEVSLTGRLDEYQPTLGTWRV